MAARKWFEMKAAADAKPAVITVFDDIGGWGVTARDFITQFNALEGTEIDLLINSTGGSVFDALAMFNAMKMSGKTINVKVMGIAASAASYLAMVGATISMPSNTFMMVHNPMTGVYGNAEELSEMADVLRKIGASLQSTYVARTGKTEEEVAALLSKDSYLTADECLAFGLCDSVTEAVAVSASFEIEHLPDAVQVMFMSAKKTLETAPAPAPAPVNALADQIVAALKEKNLDKFAVAIVADPSMSDMAVVTARISEICEIEAVCRIAGKGDQLEALVNGGKTLIEARAHITELLASVDDKTVIDGSTPSSNQPLPGVQPTAVNPAEFWAARRKSLGAKNA
ncbi:head maturation protease [Curvibacter phage PCA1]|nr:head maturation protease [Curvibacter phage PCA1]